MLFLVRLLLIYSVHSNFKLELESETDPQRQLWLLEQIRSRESGILDKMRAERARLEHKNENMEEALWRIRVMEEKSNKKN